MRARLQPRRIALHAALAAACIAGVSCGDGGRDGASASRGGALVLAALPAFDPATPFPALSEGVLDALAVDSPELAKRRDAILAAEAKAIQHVLDARRTAPGTRPAKAAPRRPAGLLQSLLEQAIPPAHAAGGNLPAVRTMIVGHNFVALLGTAGANAETSRKDPGMSEELTEGGKVIARESVAIKDGQSVASLETTVDLPLFFVGANSNVSLVGSVCPDPEGKVRFTLKQGAGGHAGKGGAATYDQHIEVKVEVHVDEAAEIAYENFDVKQDTRSTIGGRQAYVESTLSLPRPGGKSGPFKQSDIKEVRASSQVTDVERAAADQALVSGAYLAMGAVDAAKEFWQKGGCVKIVARSPGHVGPGTTSTIPVDVLHMKDHRSVPAKVTVALKGGKSVDPAVIPKAPGTVTHLAPGDTKSRMTITLETRSRRGADKMDLDLDTLAAYQAEGGLQDFHGTGRICDLAKTFTIEGGGNVVTFEPTSEKGGNYHYAGNMMGFGVFGKGTYTVTYQGDTPVGIVATGPGSVKTPMGVQTKVDTEHYSLTPRSGC